jgi:hypothetical protein
VEQNTQNNGTEKGKSLSGQLWLGVIICGTLALLSIVGWMARGTVPPPMGP